MSDDVTKIVLLIFLSALLVLLIYLHYADKKTISSAIIIALIGAIVAVFKYVA